MSNPQSQQEESKEPKVDYEKLDYDLANKQLEAIQSEIESNGPLISEKVSYFFSEIIKLPPFPLAHHDPISIFSI